MKLISIISLFTPPIISNTIKKIIVRKRQLVFDQPTGEKNADWYDKSFVARDHWRKKYNNSPHYFIWTVIIDRLIHSGVGIPSILELGCGSGQLACYLMECGVTNYVGIDFSRERINFAKQLCDKFDFVEGDFFTLDFSQYDYDTVICLETLEHIEDDIKLMMKIKSGVRFIGSVPDFPFISHVRYFRDIDEVYQRYSDLFFNFNVHRFIDTNNRHEFLISGITK